MDLAFTNGSAKKNMFEMDSSLRLESAQRRLISHILLGCIGTSVSIVGIITNVISLIILCRRSMRNNNTNLYLIALAVADLFVLITSLLTFIKDTRYDANVEADYQLWLDVPIIPSIYIYSHAFALLFQVASVWITVAFTTDRYVMICHPFFAQKHCTRKLVCIVLMSILISSIFYSIPRFFEQEIFKFNFRDNLLPSLKDLHLHSNISFTHNGTNNIVLGSHNHTVQDINDQRRMMMFVSSVLDNNTKGIVWCHTSEFGHSRAFRIGYHLVCWLIFVDIIPLTSISIMNFFLIREVRKVRQSTHRMINDPNSSSRHDTNLMLIGVIFLFLICQIPAAVSHVIWSIGIGGQTSTKSYAFMEVSNLLIILNSALNIIPYYMFGKRFRQEFVNIFCYCGKQSDPTSQLSNLRRYPLPRKLLADFDDPKCHQQMIPLENKDRDSCNYRVDFEL